MADEHEHRTEDEVLEEQADEVEDLDVPEGQQEGIAGGTPTENISLN
jgi:hypothetical protein